MKQRYIDSLINSEHGFAMTLAALMLAVLLMFVAFAVNVGDILLHRMRTQRAADAGALAAAQYVRELPQDEVVAIAEGFARDNLRAMWLDSTRATIAAQVIDSDLTASVNFNQVVVDVSYDLPYILFPGLFAGDSTVVPAQATSQHDRVIVTLLLDSSGSMWCRLDGDCSCLGVQPDGCSVDAQGNPQLRRIDKLQEAVGIFIDEVLDPTQDRLAIVTFAGGAQQMMPHRAAPGFDVAAAHDVITALQPQFDTEIALGIRKARESFNILPADAQGRRAIVLITDGSPIGLLTGEDADFDQFKQTCRLDDLRAHSASYPLTESNKDLAECLVGNWGGACSPKQHLYAIKQADLTREIGIDIHVLGFSRPPDSFIDNEINSPNYAYQLDIVGPPKWYTYHLFANSFLNQRLANSIMLDGDLDDDGVIDTQDGDQFALFQNDCVIPIAGDATLSSSRRGLALDSYDGTDLVELLLEIGDSIRPRLVG